MKTFNKANYKVQDEYYTQRKDVDLIIPYLKKEWTIWCPFDKKDSEFVKALLENNFKVIYTHIQIGGGDFFKLIDKVKFDCIVSNPPYSLKNEILSLLFARKIKFALFCNEQGMFEGIRYDLFKNNDFEMLIPRKRAKFNNPYGNQSSPPFKTNYYCSGVLPKKICWE